MAGGKPAFQCSNGAMKEAIYETMGSITALSNKFKVNENTIYRFLERNPELKKDLEEARKKDYEFMLDLSKFVSRYNLFNYLNDPALAQKVADKVQDRDLNKQSQDQVISSLFERPKWIQEANDIDKESVDGTQ